MANRRFSGFATLSTIESRRALTQLLSYLVHSYPRVRTVAAEQLYLYLTTREDADEENILEACDILTNTEWSSNGINIIKPIRDQLYPLLNIPVPNFKTKTNKEQNVS